MSKRVGLRTSTALRSSASLRSTRVGLLLGLLTGVAALGCETEAPEIEQQEAKFQESREIAKLKAEKTSLELKLADAHKQMETAAQQRDKWRVEVMRLENLRAQQQAQHELALRLNEELKGKLETERREKSIGKSENRILHDRIDELNAKITQLESTNADLARQLKKLQEVLADLRRQLEGHG